MSNTIYEGKICVYCGEQATHQFKNGKYCCKNARNKCEGYMSEKRSIKPNEIFGYWTVLEFSKSHKKYKCICSCGNTSYIKSSSLKQGKSKSCGCKSKEKTGEKIKENGFQSIKNKIYQNYTHAAKRRNYNFNLTHSEFDDLIEKNCHYCGNSPSMIYKYGRGTRSNAYNEFKYNGVDRIDNSKGYTIDNCVPCCKTCNNSKSTLSLEEWNDWLKRIFEFMKK